ncbi:hypothetical protein ACC763_40215, partial [Rhizobium ruizarguesonis]
CDNPDACPQSPPFRAKYRNLVRVRRAFIKKGYRNQQKKSVLFKAPGLLMVTRRGAMPIRFHR